jgi:hypothetical protein
MVDPIILALYLLGLFGQGTLIIASIFWGWTLIDCVVKEPADYNDKIVWLLFIIFAPLLGAFAYYFFRRPERIKTVGR